MAAQRRLWATYNEGSQGPRGVGKERKSRPGTSLRRVGSGGLVGSCPGAKAEGENSQGTQAGGSQGEGVREEFLLCKAFPPWFCPNGPSRHRPRGEEQGVTLQERGGAESRPEGCCGGREGEFHLQPPTLDAILSPPSPPPGICAEVGDAQNTLAHSYSGSYPVASRRRHGPRHGEEGRGPGVTGGLACPGGGPTQALPHPLASPERARPQRCKLFSFIDAGF